MVCKFFDKNVTSGAVTPRNKSAIRSKNILNEELAEELHKPTIKRFEKRKVHSSFRDNIWGSDLVDMELISKFNKGILFLLCVIDIF